MNRRVPLVSLVAAVAENGVIGRGGGMPWHLPEDLRRFKVLTMGKPMLMGRRTFESIGRPLPGRRSLVLSRSSDWASPGVTVVRSVEEAIEAATEADELAVVGGAEVYRLTLPLAERIYLTRVLASVSGETIFPPLEARQWRQTHREAHPPDARHAYGMIFSVLERAGGDCSATEWS